MQCGRLPKTPLGIADRPDAHLDPRRAGAGAGAVGAAGDRVRGVRVAVRVTPRPVLAGDRQLGLDALVVRLELLVGDRPVGADPVARCGSRSRRGESAARSRRSGPSSRRRRARSCSCPARPGSLAADHPLGRPVELVAAGLVGDPVAVGVPERPGLEDHDPPAAPRQALGQRRCRPRRRRRSPGRPRPRRGSAPSWRGRAGRGVWTSSRKRESLSTRAGGALGQPLDARSSRHPSPSDVLDGIEPERLARLVRARRRRAFGRGACSRAGRRGRRSRSRSTPTGASRTPHSTRAHDHRPRGRRRAAGPRRRPPARRRRRRRRSRAATARRRARTTSRRARGPPRRGPAATSRQVSRSSGIVDVLEAVEPPVVQLGVDEAHDRDPRLGVLGEHDVAERAQARELARRRRTAAAAPRSTRARTTSRVTGSQCPASASTSWSG